MQYGFGVQGIKISPEQNTEISFYFCLNTRAVSRGTVVRTEAVGAVSDRREHQEGAAPLRVPTVYCQMYSINGLKAAGSLKKFRVQKNMSECMLVNM